MMSSSAAADPGSDSSKQPLLSVRGLVKHFGGHWSWKGRWCGAVHALDGITFDVHEGETFGIVGESGCGKSTLARTVMRIVRPDAGEILFRGEPIMASGQGLSRYRRNVQMVFQDSHASLNPRLTVGDAIAFGAHAQGVTRQAATARAHDLMNRVGLEPARFVGRYPHELSGGQRQRVNIARALAVQPRLLILDEAVSALDKSIEAQVLNLLLDLRAEYGLTYMFISHDLNVVRVISDRVMVMYLGKIAEIGTTASILRSPRHPYSRALLASMPSTDPDRRTLEIPLTGDPPNPIEPPPGCRFHTRCKYAAPICVESEPAMSVIADGHRVSCLMMMPGSPHPLAPSGVPAAA
jgi:peptide/nickel transport system ATP-binding protein